MTSLKNVGWAPVFLVILAGSLAPAQAQITLSCNTSAFPSAMTVGTSYSLTCSPFGGTAPYTIVLSSGSVPTGMVSGQVGGQFIVENAPTATGSFSFTIKATDSTGKTASQSFNVTVSGITLTSVSPNAFSVGVAQTLTLVGTGFTSTSVVNFNGTPVSTTFQSATQLSASVPANLVVAGTLAVYVHDPVSGISSSPLTVNVSTPGTLTSISPTSVAAGSPAFTLTLFGTGFTSGATVNFGSNAVTSTFINSGELTAVIPAAYITNPTTVDVSAGASNSLPFVIGVANLTVNCNPASTGPTVIGTLFSQFCSVTGGNGTYTWSVTGLPAGIAPGSTTGSTLSISGTPTTPATYTYTIQASDSAGHTGKVTISGTIVSAASAYNITSLSPSSATTGSSQITVSVFGNGFTNSSVVYFNGTSMPTQVVSATQLNATVAASYLASPGTPDVVVNTAGVATNALLFSIGSGALSIVCNPGVGPTTVGSFYSVSCTVNGGTPPYNWPTPPTLPSYLTYGNSTGQTISITGVPNVAAAYNFVVRVTDSSPTVETGTLELAGQTGIGTATIGPVSVSTISPNAVALNSGAISLSVTGTGFAFNAQVLINGIAVSTTYVSSIQLTAMVPASLFTAAQTLLVSVNSPGFGNSNGVPLTVGSGGPGVPISIVCSPGVGPATYNTGYGIYCAAYGGAAPYTWSIISGLLPTGVGLTSSNGPLAIVGGSNTFDGTYSYTLQLTDSSSPAKTSTLLFAGQAGNGLLLSALSPPTAPVGSGPITLILTGSGFTPGTTVNFGSFTLAGTFVSSSQLQVTVPSADLITAQTMSVSAGNSNSLPFVITPGSSALTVTCSPLAGPTTVGIFYSQTCSVTGGVEPYTWLVSGLPSGLQQTASGTDTAIIISGTVLTAQPYSYAVQATDGSMPQLTGSVTVSGTVSAPAYGITSLSPSFVPSASAQTALTVTGTGFTSGSIVNFNGAPLATTYVGPTQLNATIPATNLTSAQAASVTVVTTGVSTNALIFAVGQTLSSLSPASIAAGSGAFTLNLFGSGFTAATNIVIFGQYAVFGTFVSTSQVIATIPADAILTSQTILVSVNNTNALPFVINKGSLNVTCLPATGPIILGSAYSQTCNVTGGTPPYMWTTTALPAGLSLSGTSGSSITISGVPTGTGVNTITVSASDNNASQLTGSATVTVTVQVSMPGTKVGVFRNNVSFLEDSNGNGLYDAGVDRFIPSFTGPGGFINGDIPVTGDWTGDGHAKIGIYRSSTGTWYLDANNNGIYDAGDYTYGYGGLSGDMPVVGDWMGLNKSCIGIYRTNGGSFWLLDLNCNGSFENTPTDAFFPFGGLPGDVPVVGSWAGGPTRVGVVRKYAPAGVPQGNPFFWVPDAGAANAGNTPANHPADITRCFAFGGLNGDVYVTGDWYGIGISQAGVYRNGLWVLDAGQPSQSQASHVTGFAFGYGGVPSDVPLTAKW
jgi:hypothetical protein